jgi:hypothetical protein
VKLRRIVWQTHRLAAAGRSVCARCGGARMDSGFSTPPTASAALRRRFVASPCQEEIGAPARPELLLPDRRVG